MLILGLYCKGRRTPTHKMLPDKVSQSSRMGRKMDDTLGFSFTHVTLRKIKIHFIFLELKAGI